MNNQSVIYFLTKRFPDEAAAVNYCVKQRWGDDISCPFGCKDTKVYNVSSSQPYKCSKCRKRFSVRTGTYMESSKIPVRIWLLAMYLMASSKTGISSAEMARQLDITQKTAWFLAHRIRHTFEQSKKLSGTVEADETYIGGKEANKHASQKSGIRGGYKGKTIVVGAKERRTGQVVCEVLDYADKTTLFKFIETYVAKGSTLFTDESICYKGVGRKGYDHRSVNHSRGEYVRGEVSTNSIESFWSIFKRAVYGTYTHLSKKHLQRYLDEFTTRGTDEDFVGRSCNSGVKPLSYNELVGKINGTQKETHRAPKGC